MQQPDSNTITGKHIVITGATDGLGLVTAVRLIAAGAHVGIVARNREKALSLYGPGLHTGQVHLFLCDLSSIEQTMCAAEEIASTFPRIDTLINNAGIMKAREELSPDGFEMSIAVNHLAVAALTGRLLASSQSLGPGSRILNVNSEGHRTSLRGGQVEVSFETWRGDNSHYSASMAYSRSKLANLLWTYELAARLRPNGIAVNALHPGSARTRLGRELPKLLTECYHRLFSVSAGQAAATLLHFATSPDLAHTSGAYFDRFNQVQSSAVSLDPGLRRRVWDETERIIRGY